MTYIDSVVACKETFNVDGSTEQMNSFAFNCRAPLLAVLGKDVKG